MIKLETTEKIDTLRELNQAELEDVAGGIEVNFQNLQGAFNFNNQQNNSSFNFHFYY